MTCGPEPVRFRILDPQAHWRSDLAPVGDGSEAEVGQVIRLRPTPASLRAMNTSWRIRLSKGIT